MILKRQFFPETIKQVDKNLVKLYYTGEISILYQPMITVVGTRNPSSYGCEMTKRIVRKLVEEGYVIVSGFAMGIDAIAHETAIEAGGQTLAVLGCGVDVDYPRSNRFLRKKVQLFLSEYEEGVRPKPWHFPKRNRLLSSLGEAVIIIECEIPSGTMITAKYAIEQGKDLWVLPGDITRKQSTGCNYLLYQGANPIYDINLLTKEDSCRQT